MTIRLIAGPLLREEVAIPASTKNMEGCRVCLRSTVSMYNSALASAELSHCVNGGTQSSRWTLRIPTISANGLPTL